MTDIGIVFLSASASFMFLMIGLTLLSDLSDKRKRFK